MQAPKSVKLCPRSYLMWLMQGSPGDTSNDLPTHHNLRPILECFPLLDLHEADLSSPVSKTVWVCQVLHSSSQCMLDTPFAGTKHMEIDIPKLTHKHKYPFSVENAFSRSWTEKLHQVNGGVQEDRHGSENE